MRTNNVKWVLIMRIGIVHPSYRSKAATATAVASPVAAATATRDRRVPKSKGFPLYSVLGLLALLARSTTCRAFRFAAPIPAGEGGFATCKFSTHLTASGWGGVRRRVGGATGARAELPPAR